MTYFLVGAGLVSALAREAKGQYVNLSTMVQITGAGQERLWLKAGQA